MRAAAYLPRCIAVEARIIISDLCWSMRWSPFFLVYSPSPRGSIDSPRKIRINGRACSLRRFLGTIGESIVFSALLYRVWQFLSASLGSRGGNVWLPVCIYSFYYGDKRYPKEDCKFMYIVFFSRKFVQRYLVGRIEWQVDNWLCRELSVLNLKVVSVVAIIIILFL